MMHASLLFALASDYKCPGSSAWIHASCKTKVSASASCEDVKAEMVARVNGQYETWHDPHNNGTYSVTDKDSDGSTLSLKRKTGDGKYTDKITFAFQDAGASSCDVYGCSESQVTSYLDFSTNYCNMFSLYCGTAEGCKVAEKDIAVEEKSVSPSSGSKSKSDCLKAVNARTASRKLFGGATRAEVTEQVRDVVGQVKAEFEKQRSLATCPMCMHVETVPRFEPVQVMKQVVAGINYFVKVQIGDDAYAFLRIYDRFGSVSLTSIQLGKTEEDDIQYFE